MKGYESKVERSINVQSRVDLITLAELHVYWAGRGEQITNKSKLVSWSLEVFYESLLISKMANRHFRTVKEAAEYLWSKRILSTDPSSSGIKKVAHAIMFENIREEGGDPETEAPLQYNTLHNQKSVVPLPNDLKPKTRIEELTEKALEIDSKTFGDEAVNKDVKEQLERHKVAAKESGHMVELPAKTHLTKESGKSTAAEIDALEQQQKARDKAYLKQLDEAEPDPKNMVKLDSE